MSTESKSKKLPAFQFYPGDWLKDPGIRGLSLEERGAWMEIMCLMHESDQRGVLLLNGKPMPEERLARALCLPTPPDNPPVKAILKALVDCGVISQRDEDGAYYCRRMVRDEMLREKAVEDGKKGGNPSLGKQKTNPPDNPPVIPPPNPPDNQKPTPSSSIAASSSSSERNTLATEQQGAVAPAAGAASHPVDHDEAPPLALGNELPPKPPRPASIAIPSNPLGATLEEQLAKLEARKAKAARFTPPTMEELGAYAAEIGMAPARAANFMDYQTAKGWKVGTAPMKCWRAALRTWNARPDFNAPTANGAPRLDKDGQLPMAPPGVPPGPGQRWHRNGSLPHLQIMTPEERAAQPHHLPPQPGEPAKVTEERNYRIREWKRLMRGEVKAGENVDNERLYKWMPTWGEMTPEERSEK